MKSAPHHHSGDDQGHGVIPGTAYQIVLLMKDAVFYSIPLLHDEAMELSGRLLQALPRDDVLLSSIQHIDRNEARALLTKAQQDIGVSVKNGEEFLVPGHPHFAKAVGQLKDLQSSLLTRDKIFSGN